MMINDDHYNDIYNDPGDDDEDDEDDYVREKRKRGLWKKQ